MSAGELHFKAKKKKKSLLKIDPHLKFYRMQFKKNEFEPQGRTKTSGRKGVKKIKINWCHIHSRVPVKKEDFNFSEERGLFSTARIAFMRL